MRVQNLKFVALPIPEIIGGNQKLDSLWIRHAPFYPKCFMGFCSHGPRWMYRPNLQSIALPVPEIIAIAVLAWGLRTPNLWEGEAVTVQRWYRLKERWWVPIFTRFRDIDPFMHQHATFPHPTSSPQNIIFPGSWRTAFGLRRAKVLG